MANVAQFLQVASAVGFTVGPKVYAVLYLREPARLGPLRFYGGGGEKECAANARGSLVMQLRASIRGNRAIELSRSNNIRVHTADTKKTDLQRPAIESTGMNEFAQNTTSDNIGTMSESLRFGGVYIGVESVEQTA